MMISNDVASFFLVAAAAFLVAVVAIIGIELKFRRQMRALRARHEAEFAELQSNAIAEIHAIAARAEELEKRAEAVERERAEAVEELYRQDVARAERVEELARLDAKLSKRAEAIAEGIARIGAIADAREARELDELDELAKGGAR